MGSAEVFNQDCNPDLDEFPDLVDHIG